MGWDTEGSSLFTALQEQLGQPLACTDGATGDDMSMVARITLCAIKAKRRNVPGCRRIPAGTSVRRELTENPYELNRWVQHHLTEIICFMRWCL
jgi:hypothetical protein